MKQFHNRFTKRGREVWDVDRLIDLVRALPVREIPLDEIHEFEEVYWFDAEHPATCRAVVEHARRIAEVDLSHPIILSATGIVMDGMHRVARARLLGRETIAAVRFERDPAPDEVHPVESRRR